MIKIILIIIKIKINNIFINKNNEINVFVDNNNFNDNIIINIKIQKNF